eukprot:CAMPEP_0185852776 /NCGR_PEP_ID=MMETSP1354-20130828/16230_1 /TAXON_ID=708628 /ORGANISM="Erythrolobus madagascarensis, Strain CCMP3276" /LENGTH=366 /DNA_ID=CAMNT_0028554121 /DNA_START=108 /DNA_END=1208 /DNA_ORIENTATION=+
MRANESGVDEVVKVAEKKEKKREVVEGEQERIIPVLSDDENARAKLMMKMLSEVEWNSDGSYSGSTGDALSELQKKRILRKFGESEPLAKPISVGEMRMYTRQKITPDSLDFTGEQDAALISASFYTTFIASAFLALLAEQYLPGPDYVRYTVTFLAGSIPFAFLLSGLSLPAVLQAGLILIRRASSKQFRDRLVRHEAGHFLVGYLLGIAVESYRANAISNAVQFTMKPASSIIITNSNNTASTNSATSVDPDEMRIDKYNHEQLDALAVVSMAGVVSELLCCDGAARGGYADLAQLQALMQRADPPLESREVQHKVRWGAVRAYSLLQQNRNALDALSLKMATNRPVPECIAAIENAHEEDQQF